MNGYPHDMFEEMDEIFSQFVARMQGGVMEGNPNVSAFRIVITGGSPPVFPADVPAMPDRASASPVAEVHRLEDEVRVIAELPGATDESIRLNVTDQELVIDADGPGTPYHTTAMLPPVDAGSLRSTFRNGVLEVTFQALPDEPAPA
jgi:HSP20 family molecular chaperone IbpA